MTPVSHPQLTAFAELAEHVCDLIVGHDSFDSEAFLKRLHVRLPELYLAGLRLPSTNILFDEDLDTDSAGTDTSLDPDALGHDEWHKLFVALSDQLGDHNTYRGTFDPYEDPEEAPVTGSLADDISDVYEDLIRGLRKWRRGESGEALWEWRFGLESHWGKHATDAIRALHSLAASWDTPWPHS